jgi:ribosomal protein S18 acetylase RimI-like enzyme
MKLKTLKLDKSRHYRDDFECGNESLNDYLKFQASQDVRKKLSICFVLTQRKNKLDRVIGYYTLSNLSISSELIPDKFRKKFPKAYKSIPLTLIGRLAVDKLYSGKGLGKLLLMEALYRSYLAANKIASIGVVVDPADDEAILFYKKYDFILIPDSGKMLLPMVTIDLLFKDF